MASFIVQTYYDFLTLEAKEDSDTIDMTEGQERFYLCMATVTTVAAVFPAYAINLAWAYGHM